MKDGQAAKETKRKSDASKKGEETKIRLKATGAYKDTGMGHMVRFLYEQGALVPLSPLASCQSDDENSLPPGLSDKFIKAQPDEDQFDILSPCLFPADTVTGVSAHVHGIVGAITDKRIHEVESVCLQRMNSYSLSKACRRLEPKGQPVDSLEQLEWVPDFLRVTKIVPEGLRGMGSPAAMVSAVGTARVDSGDWHLSGMGQYILCCRGAVLLEGQRRA